MRPENFLARSGRMPVEYRRGQNSDHAPQPSPRTEARKRFLSPSEVLLPDKGRLLQSQGSVQFLCENLSGPWGNRRCQRPSAPEHSEPMEDFRKEIELSP